MSLTEQEKRRRAYLTAAVDQMKQAVADDDAAACMAVIRRMRRDGYRVEARAMLRLLLGQDAGTHDPGE